MSLNTDLQPLKGGDNTSLVVWLANIKFQNMHRFHSTIGLPEGLALDKWIQCGAYQNEIDWCVLVQFNALFNGQQYWIFFFLCGLGNNVPFCAYFLRDE